MTKSTGIAIRKGVWISNRHGSSCVLNLRISIQYRVLSVQIWAFSIGTGNKFQCMQLQKIWPSRSGSILCSVFGIVMQYEIGIVMKYECSVVCLIFGGLHV